MTRSDGPATFRPNVSVHEMMHEHDVSLAIVTTVAFDVIGTLFTLDAARRALADVGAPTATLDVWFAESLRDAYALSLADSYTPLRDVLHATLVRAFVRSELDPAGTDDVMASMLELDPAEGAVEAVTRLGDAGFRLVTLTNGGAASTRTLLDRAGITDRFDAILSCDEVGVTKPHPRVYALAAERSPPTRWFVAAHAWDVHGAARARFRTVWISGPERHFLDVFTGPDAVAADLTTAADAILHGARE